MEHDCSFLNQTSMIYGSPYDDGFSYPDIDISELILDYNLKGVDSTKPAIIDGYSGRTVYSYGSLRHRIEKFGGFLQQVLSIKKGDVVSYLSFNTVIRFPLYPSALANKNLLRFIILLLFMLFLLLVG